MLVQVAKDETAGELVGFQVIAARDLEPMEASIALKLARHETEWKDEDGESLVSCVVQAADQPVTLPGRGGRPLGEAQSAVLQRPRNSPRPPPQAPMMVKSSCYASRSRSEPESEPTSLGNQSPAPGPARNGLLLPPR